MISVVVTAKPSECSIDKYVVVRQPFGYLSNFMTEEFGYGSVSCPWRIELARGEKVNITLIDFFTPLSDTRTTAGHPYCPLYALLTEPWSTPHVFRVCGGDRREKFVFVSRTNVVEVKVMKKSNAETEREFYFLLQFEGTLPYSIELPFILLRMTLTVTMTIIMTTK